MPPKALPVTYDEMKERIIGTTLSGQDLRAIFRNDDFRACSSRNDQVAFLKEFLPQNCFISCNAKLISTLFNISEGNVRKIFSKLRKIKKPVGRPLALSENQEKQLIDFIISKKETGEFMTQRQILNYIEEVFEKILTTGWLSSFLSRNSNIIIKTTIYPQEDNRLRIPRTNLNKYIELLKKLVQIILAELIYNIDETGLSDWEGKKPKIAIIPKEYENMILHYPINRKNRHISLIVTVNAGGDAYFPMIVTSDPNSNMLFNYGVRKNVDLILDVEQSPYVTKEIFKQHILNNFIPQVESDRNLEGCDKKPAILFIDNCSSHLDRDLLKKLAKHLILVITYPPHTSAIFQVLDRLIFGILKVRKRQIAKNPDIPPNIDYLLRIFKAYELSTCSSNVMASFHNTGFEYYNVDNVQYIKVNENAIRNFPEFKEAWNLNTQESEFSPRRRNQKWGWINKEFFKEDFQKLLDE